VLILRNYYEKDHDCLQRLANNQNVSKYLTDTFPFPYTRHDAEWWISTGCKNGINKVIEWDGEFVGAVGASVQNDERRFSAVVGYWLGEPYWGKGIAYRALNLFTDEMFNTTEVVRLFAGVFSPNTASIRVLEKSGYQLEAILKKAVYKNGDFIDEYVYAKLKS
jgi:RimJ/RimL family protein N-acetyltransferase